MIGFRTCFRDLIPELLKASEYLSEAVMSYRNQKFGEAAALFRQADMPQIRDYTESLWGAKSIYRHVCLTANIGHDAKLKRSSIRMPSSKEKAALRERDGYHCRFCSVPLIRSETRKAIQTVFPDAISWGLTNKSQHAAFQAMWLQYGHILPHSRGGDNSAENMVIACAPCNFCRMEYTLKEVRILNPFDRQPVKSSWDGLESFSEPTS